MSTKNNPGLINAYAKAAPNEPMFILLARDGSSPVTVKIWAHLWLQEINLGLRPETDRPQVAEALRCATEMEIWHRENRDRRAMAALEFDHEGHPRTGQHARKERNTTSGAND